METKTARIENEYQRILDGHHGAMLLPILATADALSQEIADRPLLLTCIFRSDREHRELLKRLGRKYYPTPHTYWRAADAQVHYYSAAETDEIARRLNEAFRYESGSGRILKACLVHGGTALHMHLQVPAGDAWAKYPRWPARE